MPREIKNSRIAKTAGLFLCAYTSLASSRKIVILDSGFCILKALLELRKIGFFASAVIKKRLYWPKHYLGDEIDRYIKRYEVGQYTSLRGKIDDISYNIFYLKEPDYTMKLFATYGSLTVPPNQTETVRIYK